MGDFRVIIQNKCKENTCLRQQMFSVYTGKINRVFNVDSLGLVEVNIYRFKISAFVLDFYTFFYIGIIFCRLFEYVIFI